MGVTPLQTCRSVLDSNSLLSPTWMLAQGAVAVRLSQMYPEACRGRNSVAVLPVASALFLGG